MPKLYLPTNFTEKITLKHEPTGRQTILLIPGASSMDISQLREIIQWQQEKFAAEATKAGPRPQSKYSRSQIGAILKDYRDTMLKRRGR